MASADLSSALLPGSLFLLTQGLCCQCSSGVELRARVTPYCRDWPVSSVGMGTLLYPRASDHEWLRAGPGRLPPGYVWILDL